MGHHKLHIRQHSRSGTFQLLNHLLLTKHLNVLATIICSRIWPKVEFQTLGSLVMKFSENTQQNCREHNQEWTKLEKIRKRLNNATAS